MFRRSIGLFCATLLCASTLQAQAPAQGGDKLDPAIEKAVFEFLDAFLNWDTQAAAEQAGYPFLLAGRGRVVVLENQEQLRQHLDRLKQSRPKPLQQRPPLRWQHRVVRSFTFEFFMQRFGQRLPEQARRDLNRTLQKGDRILLVRSVGRSPTGAAGSRRFVLVRIRDGKAVVVGRL